MNLATAFPTSNGVDDSPEYIQLLPGQENAAAAPSTSTITNESLISAAEAIGATPVILNQVT